MKKEKKEVLHIIQDRTKNPASTFFIASRGLKKKENEKGVARLPPPLTIDNEACRFFFSFFFCTFSSVKAPLFFLSFERKETQNALCVWDHVFSYSVTCLL